MNRQPNSDVLLGFQVCADGQTRPVFLDRNGRQYLLHEDQGRVYSACLHPGRARGQSTGAEAATEHRRIEEELEGSRRCFRILFENSLDGIVLFDDEGCYLDANPTMCQLLGYSREELRRLTARDVTPDANRSRIPELLSRLRSEGTLSGEYTLLRRDRATREVEYRAVANLFPGLHLAASRDITERRWATQALKRSTDRLEVLAGMLTEVQEVELGRLAREFRAEVGQMLIGLRCLLKPEDPSTDAKT